MAKKSTLCKESIVVDLVNNKESRFLKKIFEDVWVTAQTDQIPKHYSPDIVVHYGEGNFDIERLKKKIIETYHAHKNRRFFINEAYRINDLFVMIMTECGFEVETQKPYVLNSVAITRIKAKRIQEIWVRYNAPINLSSTKNYIPPGGYVTSIRRKEHKRMLGITSALTSPYDLSKRELECLVDLLQGYTAKETALRLKLSHRTVEAYLEMAKVKLGCLNKQELKEKIFPHGLWL